jgi:hypothetical protein
MHQTRVAARVTGLAIIASLVSALFLSNSVWAGDIAISVSPTAVFVGCDNFDRGNSGTVNGTSLNRGLNASGSETFDESAGAFSFEGDWNEQGSPFTPGSGSAYFVNVYGEVTGILDYTFSVSDDIGDVTGTFQFDNSTSPGLGTIPVNATTVVQDGNSFNFNNTFFHGSVTTEVDPIPEPASLAIFGLGIAGIGWVGRRGRFA